MKRSVLMLAPLILIIGLCFAPSALAGTIVAGDWISLVSYNPLDNGGIMHYAISLSSSGSNPFYLDTFCIQDNQYITLGTWYKIASITNDVGPFPPPNLAGEGTLKGAVDYLFYLYVSGRYNSYFSGSSGQANQADFQRLLWSLQGSGPAFVSVNTLWASDLAAYSDPANGLQHSWGTVVLNIIDSSGYDVQNQLYNPVPEPSTVLLLGIALGAIALAVRKL